MKKYNYDFAITAAAEKDADAKIKALSILASKLTSTELTKLANVVSTDPVKTAMAKKYLGV